MPNEWGAELGIREGDLIAEKYRVTRILGVGGMGVVVAAHHLRLDELVAIKLLLPEALSDADAVRRFEREARAAVKIKSEHVTRIIDIGATENGVPFIVMEHLTGEDLADRIARVGPLAVEETVELVLQACEAIVEAHALGIVHRDLKPANLFCLQGTDGRSSIKVLDFGISKITRAGAGTSAFGMTKTTAVMGSPYYMSPEQMESPRKVDARTDIWSLGVVLYQLLTGDVPFGGETLPQVCVNVATKTAPSLRKARPDVPAGLEAIVERCLEKDPNERYPNVAAMATALARFGPRGAQASLDRIVRVWRGAGMSTTDDAITQRRRATERPVTGPVASWGATAKSLDSRARNVVGWSLGAFLAVAAVFTWFRSDRANDTADIAAVLVDPPSGAARHGTADPSATAEPGRAADPDPVLPTPEMMVADDHARLPPTTASANTGTSTPLAAPRAAVPAPLRATDLPRASVAITESEDNPYGPRKEPIATGPDSATCTLNLNSLPAANVFVDGLRLGFTPLLGVTVTAGEHKVLFRAEDGEKRTTVRCARGESKTVAVRFHDPPPDEDLPVQNPYR